MIPSFEKDILAIKMQQLSHINTFFEENPQITIEVEEDTVMVGGGQDQMLSLCYEGVNLAENGEVPFIQFSVEDLESVIKIINTYTLFKLVGY